MKIRWLAFAGLLAAGSLGYGVRQRMLGARASGAKLFSERSTTIGAAEALPVDLRALVDSAGRGLKPSRVALDAAGKRVRIVGFMAEMEMGPAGAFYLTPRPVHCDEAGGGTADLPPESVLVVVKGAEGKVIPHAPGLLEATGILEVGNRAYADGRVAAFRLLLDGPPPSLEKGKS